MSDNNIVEFPGGKDPTKLTTEELAQAVEKGQELALDKLDENRQKGLAAADQAVWRLDNDPDMNTISDPDTELRLRNLESAVRGLTSTVEALNKLTEIIRHDLINSIDNIGEISTDLWKKGAHLQVAIDTLVKKGAITEDELRETWNEVVPAAVAAMKKQND